MTSSSVFPSNAPPEDALTSNTERCDIAVFEKIGEGEVDEGSSSESHWSEWIDKNQKGVADSDEFSFEQQLRASMRRDRKQQVGTGSTVSVRDLMKQLPVAKDNSNAISLTLTSRPKANENPRPCSRHAQMKAGTTLGNESDETENVCSEKADEESTSESHWSEWIDKDQKGVADSDEFAFEQQLRESMRRDRKQQINIGSSVSVRDLTKKPLVSPATAIKPKIKLESPSVSVKHILAKDKGETGRPGIKIEDSSVSVRDVLAKDKRRLISPRKTTQMVKIESSVSVRDLLTKEKKAVPPRSPYSIKRKPNAKATSIKQFTAPFAKDRSDRDKQPEDGTNGSKTESPKNAQISGNNHDDTAGKNVVESDSELTAEKDDQAATATDDADEQENPVAVDTNATDKSPEDQDTNAAEKEDDKPTPLTNVDEENKAVQTRPPIVPPYMVRSNRSLDDTETPVKLDSAALETAAEKEKIINVPESVQSVSTSNVDESIQDSTEHPGEPEVELESPDMSARDVDSLPDVEERMEVCPNQHSQNIPSAEEAEEGSSSESHWSEWIDKNQKGVADSDEFSFEQQLRASMRRDRKQQVGTGSSISVRDLMKQLPVAKDNANAISPIPSRKPHPSPSARQKLFVGEQAAAASGQDEVFKGSKSTVGACFVEEEEPPQDTGDRLTLDRRGSGNWSEWCNVAQDTFGEATTDFTFHAQLRASMKRDQSQRSVLQVGGEKSVKDIMKGFTPELFRPKMGSDQKSAIKAKLGSFCL
jgi:hypothetical protein